MRRLIAEIGKCAGGQLSVFLNSLLGSIAKDAFGILIYHRVCSIPTGVVKPTWNVTPRRFQQQMDGLIARGYNIWPLRRVIDYCQNNKSLPYKTTVVTFDDGYENVFLNAWPLLKKLNIPATIFVVTAYLDCNKPFPFDKWGSIHHKRASPETWRPLSWAQCQEMERSGLVEIGTHSHTHQDFRGNSKMFKKDLLDSLAIMRKQLELQSFTFAFPFGRRRLGYVDESMLEASREAGVICALTSEIELSIPKRSPFGWGRLEAVQSDTGATLKAKLDGCYNWMGYARELYRFMFYQ